MNELLRLATVHCMFRLLDGRAPVSVTLGVLPRRFTEEFKQRAGRFVLDEGKSALRQPRSWTWCRQRSCGGQAGPDGSVDWTHRTIRRRA